MRCHEVSFQRGKTTQNFPRLAQANKRQFGMPSIAWRLVCCTVSSMDDAVTYHRLDQENAQLLLGAGVFDNPVDTGQLDGFLADDVHELIFAVLGKTVIGFASGTILLHPDKAPALFVNEVGVAHDHQRQGIAQTLCNMLFDVARNRGCQGIWLATEDDNTPARALYRSLGARETGGVVVYDWDGAMDADPRNAGEQGLDDQER